jgi:hypothetical protein
MNNEQTRRTNTNTKTRHSDLWSWFNLINEQCYKQEQSTLSILNNEHEHEQDQDQRSKNKQNKEQEQEQLKQITINSNKKEQCTRTNKITN